MKHHIFENIDGIASAASLYVGMDNGPTGLVSVLDESGELVAVIEKPTVSARNYTKEYSVTTRLNVQEFAEWLRGLGSKVVSILIERPFTGAAVTAAKSAAFHEAEMIAVELAGMLGLLHVVSSVTWQSRYLPSEELTTAREAALARGDKEASRKASKEVSLSSAKLRWPSVTFKGDGDSAFIALLAKDRPLAEFRAELKLPKKKKKTKKIKKP